MVSIIKNQILKHLSKFTKNLSPNQFNFSTLKGEGELTDLKLDEVVLTDLLELPCWLRLVSADCNKVKFRIQWAKLKSIPIHLELDRVHIRVETSENLQSVSTSQGLSSYAGAAKYNFIHKTIDGMTVTINNVLIDFHSPAFTASVELLGIVVESTSPDGKIVELPGTRLKDSSKEHVLLFKQLKWQNVKLEARSSKDKHLTPLRLITQTATCKIVLKKRVRDSFIMGSRLILNLDELLWVLTDNQLKAALHFLDSLAGLIQKATEQTRKQKALRKLQVSPGQSQQSRTNDQNETMLNAASNEKKCTRFMAYDVVETSYHLIAKQIQLHFSDDDNEGQSSYPQLANGGALEVCLKFFQVDFYPYHLAANDREHWLGYKGANRYHTEWLKSAQAKFKSDVKSFAREHCLLSNTQMSESGNTPNLSSRLIDTFIDRQISTLMTSCLVLRLYDFTVYQVKASNGKHLPKKFISGDKVSISRSVLHAEFTYYYYPTDEPFPSPTPKLCVHLNPIQLNFDVITLLWLNAFALNLHQSLLMTSAAGNDDMVSSLMSFDVEITTINTKVVFEALNEHVGQRDRPGSLQIEVSRTTVTNVRHSDTGFRTDLEATVKAFQLSHLFYHSRFPCDPQDLQLQIDSFLPLCPFPAKFEELRAVVYSYEQLREILNKLPCTLRKDIWFISLEPVSGHFYGARAVEKVSFLDDLPVRLWVRLHLVPELDVQVLAQMSSLVSLQINHYQFLFLLRLSERVEELTKNLAIDTSRILKKKSDLKIVVGAILPQVDVNLLMPSTSPGKSSSGGDMESFIPDSSSLQDDNWQSSSSAVNERTKSGDEHIRFSDSTLNDRPFNGMGNPPVPKDLPLKSINEPEFREHRKLSMGHISMTDTKNAVNGLRRMFKEGYGGFKDFVGNQSPEEMSSSISIQSDMSSDNDLGPTPDHDPLETLYMNEDIEDAAECTEEEKTVSPSDRDSCTNSLKRHDLVSICTFKLRKVEALVQILGGTSTAKVEVGNVTARECTSIPWDEFQSKFNARHREFTEHLVTDGGPRQIAVRLTRKEPQEEEAGDGNLAQVEVRVSAIRLDLTTSSIAGIVDLVEDELLPTPLPATIILEDINLHIIDDRPASHITSIEPPPVDVVVRQLLVRRDASGLIEIPAPSPALVRSEEEDGALKRLKTENEDLRRRLAALERSTDENYQLKINQEQTERLLIDAQNRIESLLVEKHLLLNRMQSLQCQSEQNSKR